MEAAKPPPEPHPQLGLLKQLHIAGGGTLVLFGGTFWLLGLRGPALLEGAYALLTLLSWAGLRVFGRGIRTVAWFHVIAVMLVPFGVCLSLGGLPASGGFMVWGLIGPLAAMMFLGRRAMVVTGLLYLALLTLAAVLPPGVLGSLARLPPAWLLPVLAASNLAGASILVLATLHHFVQRMHQDQERADALLLALAPPQIAQALRHGGATAQGLVQGATILSAEVVDLAPLDAPLGPLAVSDLLGAVCTHLDSLVQAYGLTRITTTDESFMAVAGAAEADPRHAHRAATLALAMRAAVASRAFAGRRIELRVGIHSGAVRPGTLGRRSFLYDVWGRAVQLARCLDRGTGPGCIRITGETRALIEQEFLCEPGGVLFLRGVGPVEVWTLIEPRSDQSNQPRTNAAQAASETNP